MFLEVLVYPGNGEVRKLIKDKLESCENHTKTLNKKFFKNRNFKTEGNIIFLLLAEGHIAFITYFRHESSNYGRNF